MSSNSFMSHFQTKSMSTETPLSAKGGRVYAGQTLDERRQLRRQQFLDAGLEVFGSDGFRHATVRSICRRAQLTDRYFYNEFGNLEALLRAVYDHCMDGIYARLSAVFSGSSSQSDMADLVDKALLAFFSVMEDSRVARVCMMELEGVSEETNAHYLGYIRRFALLLINLARSVHPHWDISDEDSELLGIALVGAMRQITTRWLQENYASSRDSVVLSGKRIVMGLVLQLQSEFSPS
jgi:AcrR family transcriptional regulator